MAYYLSNYRPASGLRRVSYGRFPVYLPLNVVAQDEAFEITALVPGLESEDVRIEIVENTVSIRGEMKAPDGEVSFLLREIPAGEFRRTIRLPVDLDSDGAEAEISNGVLTLRVPKAEAVRPKMIEVKAR
ncbi:MAG: Hsp20/alpha crystallin family protein [Anaerolineales bacterium]|nr:Hsp20/alpha crystallin family protein [Anaerolineales bacterium]